MSIRIKLILSYLAMLIVPMILLVLTAALLVLVFQGDLQNVRNIYETKIESFEESDYHWLLKHSVEQNPALLADRDFLNEIASELSARETYVYVKSGDQVLYESAAIQTKAELLSSLVPFKREGERYFSKTKAYSNNEYYHYVRYDLLNGNKEPVSFYLIKKVDPFVYFAKKYSPYLLVAFVVILILTNAWLTYYMSKHLIRPLLALRRSAVQFTQGNLNTPVPVSGKDEIGQLGTAFEEMRTRLNHSFEVQAQYETNRKELIASISHDLKTPITSIRGYVDGLLEGIADSPEKTEKYMKTISSKAAEMDKLIDELFLFSKLDLHRLPFAFETVNVQAFLSDWAEELAFELEKKDVALTEDWQIDKTTSVNVDRDSFRRVLSNVIQNSLKFMDKPNKEIRLAASTVDGELRLSVADNGHGIPESALPFVFDRFYRAEQSRNMDTGGSGLGLAIAKRIVSEHGGTISAHSKEGIGTEIVIKLPIAKGGVAGHEEESDLDRGRR
ncbi:cell wall metabolism sensor histidine kinase WalK [Cohnella sp. AR92]|uniref:sensor histidine kinase n=1 Tax=Cohnella sp. AR92 TaxID=648716 RepID=UPI000F8F754E|nr:HAMP domain-containing sensor histidine kinase [Cohnella sp. AR92]RUS46904.1 HAMP domain-containing histidine kinase [Cohnella sp. AR92]